MGVKIIGLDKVVQEFSRISVNTTPQKLVLDTVTETTLDLLRKNTPFETGALKNSWKVILRTDNVVQIGTTADQLNKLNIILYGSKSHEIRPRGIGYPLHWQDPNTGQDRYAMKVNHPGTKPNDFVTPIANFIFANIEYLMRLKLKESSTYFSSIRTGSPQSIKTVSNIVGLTGTRFAKRRAQGRSYIGRIRTGKKRFNRRLGLRRRVGV